MIVNTAITGNTGDYRDYTLDVDVSSVTREGNAVIIIRSGTNNEILWNFHILVTDYDPDNGSVFPLDANHIFMDRNLGSNGDYSELLPEGAGLFYQWGRKDPFPGAAIMDTVTDLTIEENQRKVFNSHNQPVYTAYRDVTVLNNLRNSITHPTVFYCADADKVSVLQDWYMNSYSRTEFQNDRLWDDVKNRKTVYDPCPAGWRVPSLKNMELLIPLNGSDQWHKWVIEHGGYTWEFLFSGQIIDGELVDIFNACNLWSHSTSLTYAMAGFIYYEGSMTTLAARKLGNNVRCIKDNHQW